MAEKLAVCGIVVQDLKRSRLSNYAFNWSEVLNFDGDTGVFLQYTHARLCRWFGNYSTEFMSSKQFNMIQLLLLMVPMYHFCKIHTASYIVKNGIWPNTNSSFCLAHHLLYFFENFDLIFASLLRNSDDIPSNSSIDFKVLSEDSAVQLVLHLAK